MKSDPLHPPVTIGGAVMCPHADGATHAAQARLDRATAPDLPMEVHTPDGGVYRTRDSNEAVVEMQLREHLRRRASRGRDSMVAHLLGFFEGDAAVARAS